MIKSFTLFVEEQNRLHEATIAMSGANKDSHRKKYLDPHIDSGKAPFKIAKGHGSIEVGSMVKLKSVHEVDGKTHATVEDEHGHVERVPVSKLEKPKSTTSKGEGANRADPFFKENHHLSSVNEQLESARGKEKGIKLHINGKTYEGVHHFEKVEKPKGRKGEPKADFAIVDHAGKHLGYISHKDGTSERDYNQLGSVSHLPHTHHIIQKIVNHIVNNKLTSGTHAHILDEKNPEHAKLINQAIWGLDHGTTHKSTIDNVDHLVQGNMTIHKDEKGMHHLGAHSIHNNGESTGMKMMLYARNGANRNFGGLKGWRGLIASTAARKVHTMLS